MQMSIENAVEKEIVIDTFGGPCEASEVQEEEKEKTSEKTGENSVENDTVASVDEQKEGGQKATPSKFVEKKSINSLSEEERALIIANAKSGVDLPYFNVKFFKNGRTQITKKKETPQTVSKMEELLKPFQYNKQDSNNKEEGNSSDLFLKKIKKVPWKLGASETPAFQDKQ